MFGVTIPFEVWVVVGLVGVLMISYLVRAVVSLNSRVAALERAVGQFGSGADRRSGRAEPGATP